MPPGGIYDSIARTMAKELPKHIGDVGVEVEAVTGGGGLNMLDRLARAKPDGTTIGLIPIATWIMQAIDKPLDFDINDLSVLGLNKTAPYATFLSARAGRYSTWEEVRNSTDTVKIGAAGSSSAPLAVAMDLDEHGTKFTVARFEGNADLLLAGIAGDIDILSGGLDGPLLDALKSGDLLNGFVFGERYAPTPDLPTHLELGMPEEWTAIHPSMLFSAGLDVPAEVSDALAKALREALASSEFTEFSKTTGVPMDFSQGAEAREEVKQHSAFMENNPEYVKKYWIR